MKGRPPKPPELRRRRNKVPTAALLPPPSAMANAEVPELPAREKKSEQWHPEVIRWWTALWRSPMASKFVEVEVRGGLYTLAELYQRRWASENTDELVKVVARIDALEARYGLAPYDRHRMQWVIDQGEQAADRTKRRAAVRSVEGKDPRSYMKVAK